MTHELLRRHRKVNQLVKLADARSLLQCHARPQRAPMAMRFSAMALALCGALTWHTGASAQTWINPGTGDWFTGTNWGGGAVPAAGGGVIVNNGGTATLNAPPAATPQLNGLFIGQTGSGTGVGTVISNGVAINAGFLSIGGDAGAAGTANGVLRINGAGGTANGITIANSFTASGPSNLTGRLTVSGDFVNSANNLFVVGEAFIAGRGTVTNGRADIGGNAGSANFFVVGDVFSNVDANVGSRSTGVVNIGGNLAVSILANVGVTFDPRVANPLIPGSFFQSQASGTVEIGGTLSITTPIVSLNIGATSGGVVDGSLTVGTLNIPVANAVTMNLGNAFSRGGVAVGSFTATSGDLRVRNGLSVGTTGEGNARGTATLGGQLLNTTAGGALSVGSVGSAGTVAAQANGTVNAAGGLSGFSSYSVGVISGAQGAGTTAQGSVTGGAAAPTSNTGFIGVGSIFSSAGGGAVSATGNLSLGNSVNVTSGNSIAVGQAFIAARGSTASGTLNIAGNAGTAQFFTVGDAFSGSDADVGSRGTGVATIGGNLALTASASVGTAFNNRVVDAGAPGGVRFNQASGDATIGGTLSIAAANVSLNIGITSGGVVDGMLRVANMAMGANTLSFVGVGSAFSNGQAAGTLEINGGLLRTDSLSLGTTNSGTASGTLRMTNANLQANSVFAGTGGSATAQMILSNSQSNVATDMALIRGLLSLERSQLTVGNALTLGDDALTHIEIDGLLRGTEYGAIDALAAALDGNIEFDFGDLVFGGASVVFDILRSGSADGISGDFDGFTFLNLLPDYTATAGIELDGGFEVYRVRLTRNLVPEPGSLLLLLLGIGLLIQARRRAL